VQTTPKAMPEKFRF